jgi:hypothetical protein
MVALAVVVVMLAAAAIVETRGPAPMPYSDWLDQLDAGNVASVTFRGTEIDGRFKHPLESASSNGTKQRDTFVTMVPDFGDPTLMPELRQQRVMIDVSVPSSWTWLLGRIPWPILIFLGAMIAAGFARLVRGRRTQSGSAMPMQPMQGMIGLVAGLFAKPRQGEQPPLHEGDDRKSR